MMHFFVLIVVCFHSWVMSDVIHETTVLAKKMTHANSESVFIYNTNKREMQRKFQLRVTRKTPFLTFFLTLLHNQWRFNHFLHQLTKSLCRSLLMYGVSLMIPMNMKNNPNKIDKLFSTTDAISCNNKKIDFRCFAFKFHTYDKKWTKKSKIIYLFFLHKTTL